MGRSTTAVSAEVKEPTPPRRSGRRAVIASAVVLSLILMTAGGVWLRSAQADVELSGPAWDCVGTQLVARESLGVDDHVDELGGESQVVPELVPGMECWATWSLVSHAAVPVDVRGLRLAVGGPATGAALRITSARVDGREVTVSSPPWPDDLEVKVPVDVRLAERDEIAVSVLVEFGEGCTSKGVLEVPPTIHTASLGVPRMTTYWDEVEDGFTAPAGRALAVAGTPYSEC